MLPDTVKDWNLFIEGRGMAGKAEETTLPALKRIMESYQGGGMAGPVKLDMGQDELELGFTLAEFNVDVLRLWGIADPSGIGVRLMGASVAGDGTGVKAIEISVRGRWEEIDPGSWKKKDKDKMKVKMPLTYYRLTVNGEVLHEIDMISGKTMINGEDISLDVMRAIGAIA